MKIITKWKCPFTGQEFSPDDLTGQGNPPNSPNTPAGIGHIPMIPVVAETKTERPTQPVIPNT